MQEEHREPFNASSKLAQFNRAFSIATTVHSFARQGKNWWDAKHRYTVSISDKERIYPDVQEWLIELIPRIEQKQVSIGSKSTGELIRIHDTDITQKIHYMGHTMEIVVQQAAGVTDMLRKDNDDDWDSISPMPARGLNARIFFVCKSKEAQEIIIEKLTELQAASMEKSARKPRLHILSGWLSGSGTRLPARAIDSVVLADGQTDRIIEDMELFLESEKRYAELGIPWHRGYLFYGPPGTGKSSLAKVLAYHFGVDMYYYPLGSAGSDSSMLSSVSNIPERSILLLEDVDVFTAMKSRTDKTSGSGGAGFTMSGLLNVLDGVVTPHGLITILTTNDKAALDPAILRPGRVDLEEKLDYLQKGQAERMFEIFYGRMPEKPLDVEGIAPSRLMEIFKTHIDTPEIAESEIRDGMLESDIYVFDKEPLIYDDEDDEDL